MKRAELQRSALNLFRPVTHTNAPVRIKASRVARSYEAVPAWEQARAVVARAWTHVVPEAAPDEKAAAGVLVARVAAPAHGEQAAALRYLASRLPEAGKRAVLAQA